LGDRVKDRCEAIGRDGEADAITAPGELGVLWTIFEAVVASSILRAINS
jgi:hypothetical protein